jgi:Mn2+/Fe2+ NRAMP family transporter
MPRILAVSATHIAGVLAVLGPGFITAVVDNDAGGIFTYLRGGRALWLPAAVDAAGRSLSSSSSRRRCAPGWARSPGKGLSDLIREEFGLRITFLLMTVLRVANLTNVIAEFAAIASSLELFHISRYISVPLAAAAVWLPGGQRKLPERRKIFLLPACSM